MLELDVDRYRCAGCGTLDSAEHDGFRPVRLGARFFLKLGIPAVLEQLPPAADAPRPKPAEGRRMLTFSDSRQGSARFAVDVQREAERNFVRAFVYHTLWSRVEQVRPEKLRTLEQEVRELEAIAQPSATIAGLLEKTKRIRTRAGRRTARHRGMVAHAR
jgi:hypothetical protein